MTNNVIDMKPIDELMDNADLGFNRILAQVRTKEDAELVLDMLENITTIFIKECFSSLSYERLASCKKKIRKILKKRNRDA